MARSNSWDTTDGLHLHRNVHHGRRGMSHPPAQVGRCTEIPLHPELARQSPLSGTGCHWGARGSVERCQRGSDAPTFTPPLARSALAQGFLSLQPQSCESRARDKGVGSMAGVTRPWQHGCNSRGERCHCGFFPTLRLPSISSVSNQKVLVGRQGGGEGCREKTGEGMKEGTNTVLLLEASCPAGG